jgi:signal transduction histidine kinase
VGEARDEVRAVLFAEYPGALDAAGLAGAGLAGGLVVPLADDAGPVAALGIAFASGRSPTAAESDIVHAVAEHLAIGLRNVQSSAAIQPRQALDERVRELGAEAERTIAERRSLAAAIVLAQEQERRRVAEDLHDGPVQELVGLGLTLDALSAGLRAGAPEAAGGVARAAASARDSVKALRRAIFDLHPMALEELGFSAATRALVQRLEWRGARVSLDLEAADELSETHRTVAFRVVQEAIANVARHADPTAVAIAARAEGERIVVEVVDDGRGFDPERPRPRIEGGHLGLAAMTERAALAGGEVTIESAPGRGTALRLTLPAAAPGPAQDAGAPGSSRSAASSAPSSAKRSSTTT